VRLPIIVDLDNLYDFIVFFTILCPSRTAYFSSSAQCPTYYSLTAVLVLHRPHHWQYQLPPCVDLDVSSEIHCLPLRPREVVLRAALDLPFGEDGMSERTAISFLACPDREVSTGK
jgi:hypothetical protein